jgi:hypothetical protein
LEHVAELSSHDLELEKAKTVKAEQEVWSLKEEKKELEYYVADLLKALHVEKEKMKQIGEICRQ